MTPWVLLLLTIGCAWLCFDASRFKAPMHDEHPPTDEGTFRVIREGMAAPFGLGVLAWLFFAMTILLAVLTVREFLA